MANRIVNDQTLVANTVLTVTLDGFYSAVEVMNRGGTAEIFGTIGTAPASSVPAPTVGGNDCLLLPAAVSSDVWRLPGEDAQAVTVVKLISTGTDKVSVWGLRRGDEAGDEG